MLVLRAAGERGKEGDPVDVLGRLNAGKFAGGGEEVVKGERFVGLGAAGDIAGPPGDGRHANAAFVEIAFVSAQRAVGVEVFVLVAAFGMRAIVRGEDHQGVVVDLQLPEQFHQPADFGVHAGDHGGLAFGGVGPGLFLVDAVVGDLHAVACHATAFVVGVGNGQVEMEEKG